jgi:hypothetical protein
MTDQLDLFDLAVQSRPLTWQQAKDKRERGVQRAADHAGPDWQDAALQQLIDYARQHDRFLTEDVREYALQHGLDDPPDGRAWGHVVRRAVRLGHIDRDGYRAAKSSNCSPKPLWKSLIRDCLVTPVSATDSD